MWDYEIDWLPAGLEAIERPEILMWRHQNGPSAQQRWRNRVCFVRTEPQGVDGLIDEAMAFLDGLQFTWVVGPSSQPADVGARLSTRGLVDIGDGDLLTAELPLRGLRANADVRIIEVNDERTAALGLSLAHPLAPPAEIDSMLADRMAYLAHPTRRGGYLVAFIDDEPVANAGYRYSADGSTIYLSGAETVERFRGRGVYQSLVAYRADIAVTRGCHYAAIRARRDTSLPILVRRGFLDHGHLPIYARTA
jgi:hypothetical protein